MRGDFLSVWTETWASIWLPISAQYFTPQAVFCDLYRELSQAFKNIPTVEQLADIIDSYEQSRNAFILVKSEDIANEKALVKFFENAFEILEDIDENLSEEYINLLNKFIKKHNLGYSIRTPCLISPTLPGIFADLTNALSRLVESNQHLTDLHQAYEESFRDLRFGATEDRLKACINRQLMLLEGLASQTNDTTANTLGGICDQLAIWPHVTIKDALKKIYGFASDYPGIRHAGNPASKLRSIDARDVAAISIVLMGYAQYLSSNLDSNFLTLHSETKGRDRT